MTAAQADRKWPSRAEWQAKAEQAVRTYCTRWERLDPTIVWSTLAEQTELAERSQVVAVALRPLLSAEINRLRETFPDRPKAGRARAAWFVELPDARYEDACNLGALEEIRTKVQKGMREDRWGEVLWQASCIRKSYSGIILDPVLLAHLDSLDAILDAVTARRDLAAQQAENEAVRREMARRATDEAWEQELERRSLIDSPRVIRVGATQPAEGDRLT
jgi:hypothetical protein